MTDIFLNDCDVTTERTQSTDFQSEQPSQTMFFWADELLKLRDELDAVDFETKRLKEKYNAAERRLFDMMEQGQVDQFKRHGFSFAPSIKKQASIKADCKDEAIEWLKKSDFADIVKETVHAQTLTSLVREMLDGPQSESLDDFLEMINVFDKQSISIQRGR